LKAILHGLRRFCAFGFKALKMPNKYLFLLKRMMGIKNAKFKLDLDMLEKLQNH